MLLINLFLLSYSRILLPISGHHSLIEKVLRTANQQGNLVLYVTLEFVRSVKCCEILASHSLLTED